MKRSNIILKADLIRYNLSFQLSDINTVYNTHGYIICDDIIPLSEVDQTWKSGRVSNSSNVNIIETFHRISINEAMQFGPNADMAAEEIFFITSIVDHRYFQSFNFVRKILPGVEARCNSAALHLKKSCVNEMMPSNYCLIANLPFLSNILGSIVNC